MKLSDSFIVHESDGETMLVPTGTGGFSGMVRGNRTLGIILQLLKEETTEEQIVTAMKNRFNAPEDVILRDVQKAVSELKRIGAIDG